MASSSCSNHPSLLSLHLSKAGIRRSSLPAVFEDSDDDNKSHASNNMLRRQPTEQDDQHEEVNDAAEASSAASSVASSVASSSSPLPSPQIADEPHLSFIISKPVPTKPSAVASTSADVACSAPNAASTKLPTNLTLSASLPCVKESTGEAEQDASERNASKDSSKSSKNSKPPSVWCHRLHSDSDELESQLRKTEPNMLYNLLRSFSVSSMPALSTSASTSTTSAPCTPVNVSQRRKSSLGSLPIPLSSSTLTLPHTTFAPIKLISDTLTTPTKPALAHSTTKSPQSVLVDTTNVTAQMIKYDAAVERKRMRMSQQSSKQKPLWRRLSHFLHSSNDDHAIDSAERLNWEIQQEVRYPDTLHARLRNVKARWSLSIADARSEGRAQAESLLREARSVYRSSVDGDSTTSNANVTASASMQLFAKSGKQPRCDHCFKLHYGGPYECELNKQIRATRAHEREKRRLKSWIELHLTALRLNVGSWDTIDCPHPLAHIKNFEYGADLCNSSHMSTKSWLDIQGDTDRERNESLAESKEFHFCLKYLTEYHTKLQQKQFSVSTTRPRSSI
ncbi:hypothetical protein E3P99_01345 [Wallemia hederae]|uniref:Uncharacterized protein n=1 Tax=Wallemia hederae TaxID=1540922 RepID=A0A4T0FQD1_9BASI|nr:hypothetical protein E3P99_01345 [Wallemia hederae]